MKDRWGSAAFVFFAFWLVSLFADAREEYKNLSSSGRVYYVDSSKGSDSSSGSEKAPWKSFAPLGKAALRPGDRVVVFPGVMGGSLALEDVSGSEEAPVVISFKPGRYVWDAPSLMSRKMHISNTNDDPHGNKAIAVELKNCKNVAILGKGAQFLCKGKMMQLHIDHSENIRLRGFSFDYLRPTVSECTVMSVGEHEAVVRVHRDSRYRVENHRLVWVGDYWESAWGSRCVVQKLSRNPLIVRGGRSGIDIRGFDVEEVEPYVLRVRFEKNPGFEVGVTYQHRDIRRDYCSVFNEYSKNVRFERVSFHFMHGMGVVSQFSENIAFDRVTIAPKKGSGRTCSAWADMLHFSGCSGKITVRDTFFSGSNDDAINVHGTHLRVKEALDSRRIIVRFMHPQTWGFPAFAEGDSVQFIDSDTLNELGGNTVKSARMREDRHEMELTLESDIPSGVRVGQDVLENVSASPEVHVKNCHVELIPTRAFLLTSRNKIVIEGTQFNRTNMSAVLVADDARSWFESSMVRDLTIKNCTFNYCKEPVIAVSPENKRFDRPVHRGIKIVRNSFNMDGDEAIRLKSAEDVLIKGNKFNKQRNPQDAVRQNQCERVRVE